MGKVSVGIVSIAIVITLTAAFMVPATASLIQTNFGFPVIVHSGQSFAFSNDQASNSDIESMDIGFNLFDGMMSPSSMPEMPLAGANGWPMQGMATPDLSHMARLFDFPALTLH